MACDIPNIKIISFETDVNYCRFLENELAEKGDFQNVRIVHIDIGPTREWGYPETNLDDTKFANYLWSPIKTIRASGFKPDLILIDARFRVATLLTCVIEFPGVEIVFDDYLNRNHYHIIEEIIKPNQMAGRIALFKAPKRLSRKKILRSLSIIREYTAEPS